MAPATSFAVSTPAVYYEGDAAPLQDQAYEHRSSKGVGVAIGIAIFVALLVTLSTLVYFCIRRRRLLRAQEEQTQARTRIHSQVARASKLSPSPPPYQREMSADPFARGSRGSMRSANSWVTDKGDDSEGSIRDSGYWMIHVAMPPPLDDHPAHAQRPRA